jgi:immune inhibitor A
MVSEYSTLGVIAHEFGHDLGLPDLCDSDLSSNGIGVWDIMSYGLWLMGGRYPSLPSAWSKILLGWVKPKIVERSCFGIVINNGISDLYPGDVVKIPINQNEYFLIENRQRFGFDKYLPGEGILIWHVDESIGSIANNNVNSDPKHRRVDLEEADGRDDLDRKVNYGDYTDTFRADNIYMFTPFTYPSSISYTGSARISIINIGNSARSMTLDILIDSVPNDSSIKTILKTYKTVRVGQNYPNPFNPDTWIPFYLEQPANVTICIYNQAGRLIRTLELGHREAGDYSKQQCAAYWDGKNEFGEVAGSGIFFYILFADAHIVIRKMVLRM